MSGGGIRAGRAFIEIFSKDSELAKGLKSAIAKVKASGKEIGKVLGVGFAAGAAAAVGAAYKINEAMGEIDGIAKAARNVGVATDKLIGLQHAAELGGVGAQGMNDALKQMTIKLGDAAVKGGPLANALQAVGLSAADLAAKSPDEALAQISDAMQGMESSTQRAALANQLFGGIGVKMIDVLKDGSGALRDAQAEAEKLGLTFTAMDASKVEQANDAMTKAGSLVTGLWRKLAVQVAPIVKTVADLFVEVGASMKDSFGNDDIFNTTLWAVQKIVDGVHLAVGGFYAFKGAILAVVQDLVSVYYQIQRVQYALASTEEEQNAILKNMDSTDKQIAGLRQSSIDAFSDMRAEFAKVGNNAVIEMAVKTRAEMEAAAMQAERLAAAKKKLNQEEAVRAMITGRFKSIITGAGKFLNSIGINAENTRERGPLEKMIEAIKRSAGGLFNFGGDRDKGGGKKPPPAAVGQAITAQNHASSQEVVLSRIALGGVSARAADQAERMRRLAEDGNILSQRILEAIQKNKIEIG